MDAKTKITLRDPALFRRQCYVNGKWIDAKDRATLDVDNPANGEIIGTVPALGVDETRAAVEAADAAWGAWRSRPAKQRANLMRRWFELMMEHQEDLAVLMTTEQGKPLAESRGEIAYAASFIEIVGVNEGIISNEVAPFGGVKESGIGREGSKYGMDDFVEIKYLCMGGIDG